MFIIVWRGPRVSGLILKVPPGLWLTLGADPGPGRSHGSDSKPQPDLVQCYRLGPCISQCILEIGCETPS